MTNLFTEIKPSKFIEIVVSFGRTTESATNEIYRFKSNGKIVLTPKYTLVAGSQSIEATLREILIDNGRFDKIGAVWEEKESDAKFMKALITNVLESQKISVGN